MNDEINTRPTCSSCQAHNPASRECRRHAPVMVPAPTKDALGRQAIGAMGFFPATDPDKWCLEHVPVLLAVSH